MLHSAREGLNESTKQDEKLDKSMKKKQTFRAIILLRLNYNTNDYVELPIGFIARRLYKSDYLIKL